MSDIDVEKSAHVSERVPEGSDGVAAHSMSGSEAKRAHQLQASGIFGKLRRGEEWLDAKLGIELQGIDRIPEDEKKPPSILNVGVRSFPLINHLSN